MVFNRLDAAAGRLRAWHVLVALLVPVLVFVPALPSPLTGQDDPQLYHLAGRTTAPQPGSFVDCVRRDMREHGRFRPLHLLERVGMSASLDWGGFFLHTWPVAWMVLTAAVLLALGRTLGLGPMACVVLAWLGVLNPRAAEVWTMLAPPEHFATPLICLALLAMVRGARARRPYGWDLLGFLAAAAAVAGKEPHLLTLPGLLVARIAADLVRGRRFWTAVRRNLPLGLAFVVLGAADLLIVAYAYGQHGYSARLMGQVPLWKGLRRVFHHMATSNAYLIPIALFLGAYVVKRWYRLPAVRWGLVAVTVAALAWLIPTAGLQVKVGSARGRWIYPLTIAPAVANAMAFGFLRRDARGWARRALEAGIGVWVIYSALACVSWAAHYQGHAKLTDDVLRAIDGEVPRHGRVLLVATEPGEIGLASEMRWFIQGYGRRDVQVEACLPAAGEHPSEKAQAGRWAERFRMPLVGDCDFDRYDALVRVPVGEPMPRRLRAEIPTDFDEVTFTRCTLAEDPELPWVRQITARVYLRRGVSREARTRATGKGLAPRLPLEYPVLPFPGTP